MPTNTRTAIIDTYAQAIIDGAGVSDSQVGTASVDGGAESVRTVADRAAELSLAFQRFSSAFDETPELRLRLTDEGLSLDVRYGLIERLFPDIPQVILVVARLLIEREELGLLRFIDDRLTTLIEEQFGVVVIDVTTVVELDDSLRRVIKEKYAAQLNKSIALREHIDPSIMGGIVMRVRGRLIDASLSAQLSRAREVLTGDSVGGAS